MINFNIKTENSSDHWRYFDVRNENVLDLGCGRWQVKNKEEFSPIYFLKNGANKVLGIDKDINEINFFKDNFKNQTNFSAKCMDISNYKDIKNLIDENDISAIKSDIEGDEWLIAKDFKTEDFININEMAIEYHSLKIRSRFIDKIKEWGFNLKAHGQLKIKNYGVLFMEKTKEKRKVELRDSIIFENPPRNKY